ncbi:MAG: urea ABC transporter permease subunit UrtB [Myxococcales bacterium]|nr:urea ABC transporter permease subunit UrtB [Myxococcales bacterium]
MFASAALAQDIGSMAAQLASGDRKQARAAIEQLGSSEHPAALTILQALEQRQLRASDSGQLFVQDAERGVLLDPISGKPVTAPAGVKKVAVTNAIRRALKSALARQQLGSEDRIVRRAAAEVLAKSPSADMGDTIRDALGTESDFQTREMLSVALAQIDLESDNRTLRLAAVKTIGDVGELSLKPKLETMVKQGADGGYGETDEGVRKEARKALSALERKEFFVRIVRDLFYGLSLGSVLLLAALGLAITFGLMGVINMAHGEMLMLGAYSAFVVQGIFQKHLPAAFDWYIVAAIPVAFIVCFLVGVLLERTVIRFLYGRPLETLLATWGISLIIIQTVRMIFGAQNVTVANPSWLSGGYELVPGVVLPYARLATMIFVAAVVAFVWYLLNRTNLGLQVRAITQNRTMARAMGIRTSRVDMLTFGLGSAVAGLGGVALSQLGNVGPELGQGYIVDSFMVVVVGGVGEIAGTVVAALGLGTVNKILEPVSGAVLGKIFVLGFIILFIQRRPQGLFALKGRAAES